MPFKSKAQQKYLYDSKPKGVYGKLPDKVKKKSKRDALLRMGK